MFREEAAQEGEGEVRQRRREQHAACAIVKCDGRLFVGATHDLATPSGPAAAATPTTGDCRFPPRTVVEYDLDKILIWP